MSFIQISSDAQISTQYNKTRYKTFTCSATGCSKWYMHQSSLNRHCKTQHGIEQPTKLVQTEAERRDRRKEAQRRYYQNKKIRTKLAERRMQRIKSKELQWKRASTWSREMIIKYKEAVQSVFEDDYSSEAEDW
jgi:hypothetical protein